MKWWCFGCAAMTMAMLAVPVEVLARQADVGVTGSAVLSIQSTDDTYQSPYLDPPIGGVGPGFGVGISVINGGFVAIGEVTSARYEQEQIGRVIPGNCIRIPLSSECEATTRLHDSLLTGLAGWAFSGGKTRTLFVGGVSMLLDSATTNDVSIYVNDEVSHHPGLTGGIEGILTLGPRIAIDVGARYTYLRRSDREVEIGAGPHILRAFAGVRVKVN